MQVQIEITGLKEVEAKLKRLKTGLNLLQGSFAKIGKILVEEYSDKAFASQGQSLGMPWPKLNAGYAVWKAEHYDGTGTLPLIRTGTMQKSFFTIGGPTSLIVGNSASYFKYHQSSLPRTHLPRRAMMGVTGPLKTRMASIITADIKEKLSHV